MPNRLFRLVIAVLILLGIATPAGASDDVYTARQWGLRKVGAEAAWDVGRGKGITIAIIDTGVDATHEDLEGSIVKGYDFVDGDADPSDENGHGTHVAGIAAARADNGIGVAGVAPEAKIMPIRVLDARGGGSISDIDEGTRWAVDHGADVVNLSISDGALEEAITGGSLSSTVEYAWSKGVVPVIAAGNGSLFRTEFQGAHTLLVTATTTDDRKASYATSVGFGRWGIAAPGGADTDGKASMVFSTFWAKKSRDRYGWAMGTSMAAPHVAGAAAILRGLGLSPQQTVDRLLSTARDIGSSFDYGAGLLDAAAAVRGLGPAKPQNRPAGTTRTATSAPRESAAVGSAIDRPETLASSEAARVDVTVESAAPTTFAVPVAADAPRAASTLLFVGGLAMGLIALVGVGWMQIARARAAR